ncbi:MAG: hypothetical protein WC792_01930 [Candidatus Micrarchaeia archaeon]|jgi:vacuolar-type H+-ATPase subunit H
MDAHATGHAKGGAEEKFSASVAALEKEEANSKERIAQAQKAKEANVLKARADAEKILETARSNAAEEKNALVLSEKKAVEKKGAKEITDAQEEAKELLKDNKAADAAAKKLAAEFSEKILSGHASGNKKH